MFSNEFLNMSDKNNYIFVLEERESLLVESIRMLPSLERDFNGLFITA